MAVGSYLLGNINNAVIISKLKKSDVRKIGSGNPGTLNMSRSFGLKLGLLVFLLDILKGAIPTLVGFLLFKGETVNSFYLSDIAMCLCGFCAVMGHIYPVFMKFKGGKGIASTIGVFIIASFITISNCFGDYQTWAWAIVSIMSLVAAVVFIYFTEFGAMGSFIAITPQAIALATRFFLMYGANEKVLLLNMIANSFIWLICFFTWFAHRNNIKRMLAGEEHPTSIKEMVVKAKLKKQQAKEEAKEKNKTN